MWTCVLSVESKGRQRPSLACWLSGVSPLWVGRLNRRSGWQPGMSYVGSTTGSLGKAWGDVNRGAQVCAVGYVPCINLGRSAAAGGRYAPTSSHRNSRFSARWAGSASAQAVHRGWQRAMRPPSEAVGCLQAVNAKQAGTLVTPGAVSRARCVREVCLCEARPR